MLLSYCLWKEIFVNLSMYMIANFIIYYEKRHRTSLLSFDQGATSIRSMASGAFIRIAPDVLLGYTHPKEILALLTAGGASAREHPRARRWRISACRIRAAAARAVSVRCAYRLRRILDEIATDMSPHEFASLALTSPVSICELAIVCIVTTDTKTTRGWDFDANAPRRRVFFPCTPMMMESSPHAWSSSLTARVSIRNRARVHATYRVSGVTMIRVCRNRTVAALVY